MKKSIELADKVYEVLKEKCEKEFEEKSWREWHVVLRDRGIECKGFDVASDQIEELMRIINHRSDEFVVCNDPWIFVNEEYGYEGFLIVPIEIAEKIAILRGLP